MAFAVLTTAGGGGLLPAIIFMIDMTLMPAMRAISATTATIMIIMRLAVLGFSSTRVCMRGSPPCESMLVVALTMLCLRGATGAGAVGRMYGPARSFERSIHRWFLVFCRGVAVT